jgi:hypothetical protein
MRLLSAGGLAAAAPPATNYDEAKVPAYRLPDPLACFDGQAVTNEALWRGKRRPEILEAFATNVYGRTPAVPIRLRFEPGSVATNALGGLATRKEVVIRLFEEPDAPWIDLLLFVPNDAPKPAPVFLGLNYGNQGVHPDPAIKPSRQTKTRPGEQASRWPLEAIMKRGYAVATFAGADVEQDRHGSGTFQKPDGWKEGVRGHWLRMSGLPDPDDDAWGSIGAWAWGLSRAMDYLETDPACDRCRVVVFGHSRTGKTALWAGAQDERFAIIVSNESGEGGASLSRRWYGETIAHLVSGPDIWFCRNYRRFAGNESALPVDQHLLIALIAPRPVYVASAEEDRWADPHGEFLAARQAEPVYRLFGLPGIDVRDMPPANTPVGATIGYHMRTGKHDITAYDWQQFLAFADRHFAPGRDAR